MGGIVLTTLLQEIGDRLRVLRKKQFPDDTQRSFALRIGINRNTLSAIENGQGNVGISHYIKIAELLGCEGHFEQLFKIAPGKKSLFDENETTE